MFSILLTSQTHFMILKEYSKSYASLALTSQMNLQIFHYILTTPPHHETEQSGKDGGHGPRWVPGVRVEVTDG